MQLPQIRAEIEHMRRHPQRQRKDIQALQFSGVGTAAAEELLFRMLVNVDQLAAGRGQLIGEQPWMYPDTSRLINGPIERRVR